MSETDKKCAVCGTLKPTTNFYKNDSYIHRVCKECEEARRRERRKANPEVFRERDKKWRHNNPDKVAAHSRRYREKHGEKHAKAKQRWNQADPKRRKAHYAVQTAIRRGDLVKQDKCEI